MRQLSLLRERMELPPPARKTIDLEGRIVKDGVRKAIQDRQIVLADLVHAFREYRRLAESAPLTLQGSDHAHAVHEMNKVIDRAAARRRKRSESVGLLPTHSFPAWRIQSLVINPSDIRTYPAAFTETEDKHFGRIESPSTASLLENPQLVEGASFAIKVSSVSDAKD